MNTVEVGGVKVTQGLLEEMHAWLAKKVPSVYQEGYKPRICALRRGEGNAFSQEELVYEEILSAATGSGQTTGFKERFVQREEPALRPTIGILSRAGFSGVTIRAMGHLQREIPQGVLDWVGEVTSTSGATPWLWLKGGTGAGKTCAAAKAVIEVAHAMDRGEIDSGAILFMHIPTMCLQMTSAPQWGPDNGIARMKGYCDASLLVLDDLGVEDSTQRNWSNLSYIIDTRYKALKPTVITTQYGGGEWLQKYRNVIDKGARSRIGSRIAHALAGYERDEGGQASLHRHVVDFSGDDLRGNINRI